MTVNLGKRRLLFLARLLYLESDERHPMSTNVLFEYFSKLGMRPDRKTLKSDIELLTELGMDIIAIHGNPIRYFIGNRGFELPEVKLLIDAVQSSRFITAKKSEALTKKLSSYLVSKHQGKALYRNLHTGSRIKPANEQIFVYVDGIFDAINNNKQISFQYIEYTPNKQRTAKHGGFIYELTPYAMLWNGDYYYCVGFSRSHNKVVTFRVDRMKGMVVTEAVAVPPPASFNVKDYYTGIFDMFDGDDMEVELLCENRHMKSVVDQFGEKVSTRITDSEHFIATVSVSVSPTFLSWVFQFCGEIKIISPPAAVDTYREMCLK